MLQTNTKFKWDVQKLEHFNTLECLLSILTAPGAVNDYWNTEAAQFDCLHRITDSQITELIEYAGLPPLDVPQDDTICSSLDWCYMLTDEERARYNNDCIRWENESGERKKSEDFFNSVRDCLSDYIDEIKSSEYIKAAQKFGY